MKEHVIFQSGCCVQDNNTDDYEVLADILDAVMKEIEVVFEPSVLVGTVGRWNGTFPGYKYCRNFKGFQASISGYDDLTIKQIGTRLHFILLHHDGKHEMELRRLSDYGYNNRDKVCFDYFTEATLKFINKHTKNFGKIQN